MTNIDARTSATSRSHRERPQWESAYRLTLAAADTAAVIVSVGVAQLLRFQGDAPALTIAYLREHRFESPYTLVSASVAAFWLLALAVFQTRDPKLYGSGTKEFKQVLLASLTALGAIAVAAYLLRADIGRIYLIGALPIGVGLLLVSRLVLRRQLLRSRTDRRNRYRTIIVGEENKTVHAAQAIVTDPHSRYQLVGVLCDKDDGELLPGVPIIGNYNELDRIIATDSIDAVIVTGADMISSSDLRRISWELGARGVDFVVALPLTDVASPRIHTQTVSGLAMADVYHTEFGGPKRIVKRIIDVIAATMILILLSPLFLILASIIKLDSKGPVLFRQMRVGVDGARFSMLKFRTMITDAEKALPALLDRSEGNGVLFKMRHDPRVTSAGRWMRRYSLDEVPQLINVIRGEMSLVGPRPALPRETELYTDPMHRRHLVKPGITGLWQVSGRSGLALDESIRLDLYYVENWSIGLDFVIASKTVRAVLKTDGAY